MFQRERTNNPFKWIKLKIEHLLWYLNSDVDLIINTVWTDGLEEPYTFFFYSKKPRDKRYQFHAESKIEDLHKIKDLLERSIEANKKGIILVINGGIGREEVEIHQGSMKKALDLINQFYEKNPEFIPNILTKR